MGLFILTFSQPVGATSVTLKQSMNNGNTWVDMPIPLDATSNSVVVDGLYSGIIKYKLVVVGGSKEGDSNVVDVVGVLS